ncbi:MAG: hypothetical protein A2086_16590 [Spirochaetes bacterium GWD1_27_9]|nr:MAG: hypothetical protein A2Z98_06560 [Spirochaetes bacterium GWB1_27_13]OHD28323.1 MAG: hypothetical protein A2Y34_09930 [Spirochaetes bacterium GWC1_27_15]OHD29211.1 MAG: hypothetical protein A2086_16590 [Spirochaetes bacterium GWD1_27_9]
MKNRILVVEDEIINAILLQKLLEKEYADTICKIVATGEEAIDEILLHHYKLIIMDIILAGELNGIETVHIIQEKYNINIPVIYLTASSERSTFLKAKETKMIDYINKPFNDFKLNKALKKGLGSQ